MSRLHTLLAAVCLVAAPPVSAQVAEGQTPSVQLTVLGERGGDASDSASEGMGVFGVVGELALVDPGGDHELAGGGGLGLQLVAARTGFRPLLLGVSGGAVVAASRETGPVVDTAGTHQPLVIGTTHVRRDFTLWHAELLLRVQPLWGAVRPFVEGASGVALLWQDVHWVAEGGESLARLRDKRSLALVYGATFGVDWRLVSLGRGPSGSLDLVVSAGLKCLATTSVDRQEFFVAEDGSLASRTAHAPLTLWMPFLALSIGVDTRPEARTQANTTP